MRWDCSDSNCTSQTNPRIRVKSTANSTLWEPARLYQWSGDPAVAENPGPGGVAQNRMYVVGLDFEPGHYPSRLRSWSTDNGGATDFSASSTIWAEEGETNGYDRWFVDKPATAVSWYSGTRGYIYVAATRVDIDSNHVTHPNQLIVFRSTDGGVTWSFTALMAKDWNGGCCNPFLADDAPQGVQIVTDNSNGNVYLIWLDWYTNTIYAAKSDSGAGSFTLLGSMSGLQLISGVGLNGRTINGMSATTMLAARYNLLAHKIGVVWHARKSSGFGSDVYFAYLDTTTDTWGGKRIVNDAIANDQWNPALDWDTTGTWLITFYDRRNDPNNLNYRVYGHRLNGDGSNYDMADTALTSVDSITSQLPYDGAVRELGEYQDVWYWRDWMGVHIYALSPNPAGVYTTHVVP